MAKHWDSFLTYCIHSGYKPHDVNTNDVHSHIKLQLRLNDSLYSKAPWQWKQLV